MNLLDTYIYYEVVYRTAITTSSFNSGTNIWTFFIENVLHFKDIEYEFTNNIQANFEISKNVSVSIINSSDIEPYHTKTKALPAILALNEIFKTNNKISKRVPNHNWVY